MYLLLDLGKGRQRQRMAGGEPFRGLVPGHGEIAHALIEDEACGLGGDALAQEPEAVIHAIAASVSHGPLLRRCPPASRPATDPRFPHR